MALNSETIYETLVKIHGKEYLMPGIQREFVWNTEQIELLFDSLLRGYPISTFLFWELDDVEGKKYTFFEFTREYSALDHYHNTPQVPFAAKNVVSVLDGQQRLTSFYIGLYGSYAYRRKGARKGVRENYPIRSLYLNLDKESEENDRQYDFKFRTDDEHLKNPQGWYKVSEMSYHDTPYKINNWLKANDLETVFSSETLNDFFQKIHKDKEINFFLEKSTDIERVLDIFIRVNSGGTELTYSDLLLSMSVALWKNKDAKKEINSLKEDLNNIGNGFNFNKDFILKSCLVLSELDIAFKVKNFGKNNVAIIEKNWDGIKTALTLTVNLLASFGYDGKRLTSNNSIIPIAYFLQKINSPVAFITSTKYIDDRKKIRKFINIVLLKGIFGGQPDSVLTPIRDIIKNSQNDNFPFDAIVHRFRSHASKSMGFTDDQILNIFSLKYKQAQTFSVLAFIYPTLDFQNQFHQDHIFPKKFFTQTKLQEALPQITQNEIKYYLAKFNSVANIQLLEGVINEEKSAEVFSEWIERTYPDIDERTKYMDKNYIPKDISLDLKNFKEFIEMREGLIKQKFNKVRNE